MEKSTIDLKIKKFAIGLDADQNVIHINDRVKFFEGEYAIENELEVILVDFFLNEVSAKEIREIKPTNCLCLVDRKTGNCVPRKNSSERIRQNDIRFSSCRLVK